ncbi:hypothetical protein NDU88_002981 [Pleurodeles waltl]|uniref:Uncharacterized protein n=1 Tax=Pleurodeles waltl TaxID=8319 RepID=A0AAV7LHH4_PLEWA|nr:hypothetical protein NDU88_002981 [Pleurodeles waltl]
MGSLPCLMRWVSCRLSALPLVSDRAVLTVSHASAQNTGCWLSARASKAAFILRFVQEAAIAPAAPLTSVQPSAIIHLKVAVLRYLGLPDRRNDKIRFETEKFQALSYTQTERR